MERPIAAIAMLLALVQPAWGQEHQTHEEFRRGVEQEVEAGRRDLRLRQDVLTPSELREGERRMDAIRDRARTDPHAAQDMQRILDADRSLSTVNRPIPGGPP